MQRGTGAHWGRAVAEHASAAAPSSAGRCGVASRWRRAGWRRQPGPPPANPVHHRCGWGAWPWGSRYGSAPI